jgi:transcriptional regulator with XRE-family HTH domain
MHIVSTRIVSEKDKDLGENFDSVSCLPKNPLETPQDYVRRIIADKGLSHVKVAQRAKKLGGDLSPGYVNSVIQGHVKSPGIDMLYNLSLGLGEPVEDLIAVYLGRIMPTDTGFKKSAAYALYQEYERLETEPDKREVKGLIEVIKREIQRRTAKN